MVVRVGLAGLGYMGRLHLDRLGKMPGVTLAGVIDPDPAALKFVAGIKVFKSVKAMATSPDIDAIVIATPSRLHYEHAGTALLGEKHVLVEKPLADTVTGAEGLVALQAALPGILMPGHVERFNPAIEALVARLFGHVPRLIETRRSGFNNPRPSARAAGVGVELATHDVDVMNWLHGGPPVVAHGLLAGTNSDGGEDALIGVLAWADGGIGSVSADWVSPSKVRSLRALVDGGAFQADYLTGDLRWHPASGQVETMRAPLGPDPLSKELAHFIACINGEETPRVTAQDGLDAVATVARLVAP